MLQRYLRFGFFWAMMTLAVPGFAAQVINDTFDIGDPPSAANDPADPLDVAWGGVLPLVNDNVPGGINSGNALQLLRSSFYWPFCSFLPHTLNPGDSLHFSFTVRYTNSPTSDNIGLRFGVGSDSGTYGFALGVGSIGGNVAIFRAGSQSLSGIGVGYPGFGSIPPINDTLPHHISLTITRTPTAIDFSGMVDGLPFGGTDTNATFVTFKNLGIGIGPVINTFRFDNVSLQISVACQPVTSSPSILPDGQVGVSYPGATLSSSGGTAPYTYNVIAGALPTGLALSTSGTFSGNAQIAGKFNFTVQARDHYGCLGTRDLTLTVVGPTLTVTGDRTGLGGTTHAMAFDGNLGTFFRSSHNDWQFLQINCSRTGSFAGLRRYMSLDGTNISGLRMAQGESISYSVDGSTWIEVTGQNAHGWEGYGNYGDRQQAWGMVPYGWSAWLNLDTPVQARYLRFLWDGDSDALNEVELQFVLPDDTLAPGDFGASADLIDFDNLQAGARLTSQLRMNGVRIQSGDGGALIVSNTLSAGIQAQSAPLVLAASTTNPVLEFQFDFPRVKAGLYFARPGAGGPTRALLRAFDSTDHLLAESLVTVNGSPAANVGNFIGVAAPSNSIRRLSLTFEGKPAPTLIDDLLLDPSPSNLEAITNAVAPWRAVLRSSEASAQEQLEAVSALLLMPSPLASDVLKETIKNASDNYVRETAIHALSQFNDINALSALVEVALKTTNAAVRAAAQNAVWSLRRQFPLPNPPEITISALTPIRLGQPFEVEARVRATAGQPMAQIGFRSSKQLHLLDGHDPTNHYTGLLKESEEIVLRARYYIPTNATGTNPVYTSLPFSVRLSQNRVDATTYHAPLYLTADANGGSASSTPPAYWKPMVSHILPLRGNDSEGNPPGFVAAAAAPRPFSTTVKGTIVYQDGDTQGNRQYPAEDTQVDASFQPVDPPKPCPLVIVTVVDAHDTGRAFGSGVTDSTGAFRIRVDDIPPNISLALLLEVDNFVCKIFLDTDVGDEEFKGLIAPFPSGTFGPINVGTNGILPHYELVTADENGFWFGGETRYWASFGAVMNINSVLQLARADIDQHRDPREEDPIDPVDVEHPDGAWNHYFEDLVLTGIGLDVGANSEYLDFGFVDSTIGHEYMHHLQYSIGTWDGHPFDSSHGFCTEIDPLVDNGPEFAWSEGLANYFGEHLARNTPGMSLVRLASRNTEMGCGFASNPVSVEGQITAALWDLSDGWGQGALNDAWDQVDGPAFNAHGIILQIFDHEMADAGLLLGVLDDAPDFTEFYRAWQGRFGPDTPFGTSVFDPILNALGMVPGHDGNKQQPFPVVERWPVLPEATLETPAHTEFLSCSVDPCSTLQRTSRSVGESRRPQYDSPLPSVFTDGKQPVLTITRHWSFLDAQPDASGAADVFNLRIGMSNLRRPPNVDIEDSGSPLAADTATYSVSVQFGPGAANWLEVTPANGSFSWEGNPTTDPPLAIHFLPSAHELPGPRQYQADIVIQFQAGSQTHHRTVRVIFDQVTGSNDDYDHDGLSNQTERMLASSGLCVGVHTVDPRNCDSDFDGLSDGDEVNRGTSICLRDTDQDGLIDGVEVCHALNPLNAADATGDPDNDGLSNLEEIRLGTNLNDPDTDDDGWLDGPGANGMGQKDNCPREPNPNQLDTDHDGIGDLCDTDTDGDGCPDVRDESPTAPGGCRKPTVFNKFPGILVQPDPRLEDPRWQIRLDNLRPDGPDSCGPLSCPSPSVTLIAPDGSPLPPISASDHGFDQWSCFACAAELLPDLDADGFPEIAIGVPNADIWFGFQEVGQVLIVSGRTGAELSRTWGEQPSTKLGSSFALMNGGELAIGGVGSSAVGGSVRILRLSDFSILETINGSGPGDLFGTALATGEVGGRAELIVGAPGDGGSGAVYAWNPEIGLRSVATGTADGDEFGSVILWAGDITKDGYADLLIGAPGAGGTLLGGLRPAAAASSGAGEVSLVSLTGRRHWTVGGRESGERFGAAAVVIPRQASVDFLVGAPGWNNQQGRACYLTPEGQITLVFEGDTAGGQFGARVGIGPDFDGDGQPSLVILETGANNSSNTPGESTVYQVFARPHILSLQRLDQSHVELRFTGEAGVTHGIQQSSDLLDWQRLISLVAAPGTNSIVVTNPPTASPSFYRIASP